ncbi:helix-turn-helix domain-containing protein [Nonomuraea sp. SBT364]|uniref:helix-turn-helix domain-containing protein n=1 Tax=Nonomuraea sp. SBT364 TaxID=1580530 RepID=UPI0009EC783E|nr:XRE family transcriptional regulator [Nonomuraea sp. SBT364]
MFTPERLVLARKRRRMTLAGLARESGVSSQSLTAYENGRKTPSPDTLLLIANALQFPVPFFALPAPLELPADAVSFRAPSKMSALERESTLSAGMVATDLNRWLEERFKLPALNIPTLPHLHPGEAAERVRAYWGLGESPVPNMVHLLEANGVRVFSLPPDCLDVDAFTTTRPGTPFVFLNTRKSGERGRFDAAHELGHLVLHCEHRIPGSKETENEANEFASAFLMPRAGLLAQKVYDASVERILSAKRRWGVSAMALTYRLHRLKLLSDWRYHQTAKQLTQMGYRAGEPGSVLTRESSQLLAKVFEALRSQGITSADFAAQLRLSPEDLNGYVFGLIPTALQGGGQQTSTARPQLRLLHSN